MLRIERELLRYRAGFLAVIVFLFFLLVLLPFSIASVVTDILGLPNGETLYLLDGQEGGQSGSDLAHFHITIINVDEGQQTASLRVAADRRCVAGCSDDLSFSLVALGARDIDAHDPPAVATLTIKGGTDDTTETITLPVSGNPIRYPFDQYKLRLATSLERVAPGQPAQPISRESALGQIRITAREHLTRMIMDTPQPAQPEGATGLRSRDYLTDVSLTFERPFYLRVLALALVLLIAAAAAGAVFMRPVTDLFISSGSLVIGVWGIRGILVPGTPTYVTAVDLSLSVVILFLLSAIIVRLAAYFHQRGRLPTPVPPMPPVLPRRSERQAPDEVGQR